MDVTRPFLEDRELSEKDLGDVQLTVHTRCVSVTAVGNAILLSAIVL